MYAKKRIFFENFSILSFKTTQKNTKTGLLL